MLRLFRLLACYGLALLLAVLVLLGLLFSQQGALIKALLDSAKWLSEWLLQVLPASFWQDVSGVSHAATHPAVQSFLQLCVALGRLAVLPALALYRRWYRP